jgi:hypothetical protein
VKIYKHRLIALLLSAGYSLAPLSPAVAAPEEPVAAWTSPAAGTTVTGPFNLSATYDVAPGSTASLTKVCLAMDGYALVARGLGAVTDGGGGCNTWSIHPGGDTWSLDSTGWTNGPHTFTVQVTDSNGRVSNAATITLNSKNASAKSPSSGGTDSSGGGDQVTPDKNMTVNCTSASTQVCSVKITSSPASSWPAKAPIKLTIYVKTTGYSKTYTATGSSNGVTKMKVPSPSGSGFAAWTISVASGSATDSQDWTRGSPTIVSSGKALPLGVTYKGVVATGTAYFCKALPNQMKNINTWMIADPFAFSSTYHAYNYWDASFYVTVENKSHYAVVYVPYNIALRYKCPFAFRVGTP